MKRWAFNLLAGASLALAVLTAGLWVRSYWAEDILIYNMQGASLAFSNPRGQLAVALYDSTHPAAVRGWSRIQRAPGNWKWTTHNSDWRFGPMELEVGSGFCEVALQHWSLLLLFSLAPTAWLLRGPLLRRRRAKLGLCRHCGYDLRATPERCPECGEPGIGRR